MRDFLKNIIKGTAYAAIGLAIFATCLVGLVVFAATGFGIV